MKILYLILGLFFTGLATIGAFLPVLPTTPFLLVAAFCFAKSSEKFHKWLTNTKMYKKHLESFSKDRAMTMDTKVKILTLSSTMMIISFILINSIYARVTIGLCLIFEYYYFIFKIKTIKENKSNDGKQKINN